MSKELLEAIKGLEAGGKEDLAKILGIDVASLESGLKENKVEVKDGVGNEKEKVATSAEKEKKTEARVGIFRKSTKGLVLGGTSGAVTGKDWKAWFQILRKQVRHSNAREIQRKIHQGS